MILVPGQEISLGSSQAGTTTHIVAANIRETLPLRDFDHSTDPQRAIDLTEEQGGFTIIAHPYWSGLHAGDILKLSGARAGTDLIRDEDTTGGNENAGTKGDDTSVPHLKINLKGGNQTLNLRG